jgi:hypothetical protein
MGFGRSDVTLAGVAPQFDASLQSGAGLPHHLYADVANDASDILAHSLASLAADQRSYALMRFFNTGPSFSR